VEIGGIGVWMKSALWVGHPQSPSQVNTWDCGVGEGAAAKRHIEGRLALLRGDSGSRLDT
jgi:hypothetical protein